MGSEVPQRGPDPQEPHVGVTDVTSLPGNMTVTTEAVTTALEEASAAGPHSFIHSLSRGMLRPALCQTLGSVLGESKGQLWSFPSKTPQARGELRWELPVTKQHVCAGQRKTLGPQENRGSRYLPRLGVGRS